MDSEILTIKSVSKKIKNKPILEDISLVLKPGEIVGLIGANGAGKTTLLRLITGLSSISTGTITINNSNVETQFKQAMSHVGSLIETPDFYNYLTGFENLRLFSNMLSETVSDEDLLKSLEKVKLSDVYKKKVATYSLGMRQRLGIGLSLLGNPRLLLLDEPLNGIDPSGILEIKKILHNLSMNGTAIFISSHQLSELESLCTKYILLDKGSIVKKGIINDMSEVELDQPSNYLINTSDNQRVLTLLAPREISYKNNALQVNCSIHELNDVLKTILENDILIYEIHSNQSMLEHLFQEKDEA